MIEVLVTIVIIAFGLLGLAGLLSRLQSSEMEAYQRSQALLLLNDMANRIAANRSNHTSYPDAATTTSPLGVGITCSGVTVTSPTAVAQSDLREWCEALQGAGETNTAGAKVGAMIGGRGCIETVGAAPAIAYRVTVAWQGLTPISAPPVAIACGAGSYDSTGTACVNDLCRRTVTTVVQIATLS
jgi:type IV pilus assembly protein PilV